MHTTEVDGGITFVHNGDYSGDVRVKIPAETALVELHHGSDRIEVRIPFAAMEELVAEKYRSLMIEHLEQAEIAEIMEDAIERRLT